MTRANRFTWAAWIGFVVLVVAVKFDVAPSAGNVFNIYREAAIRWSQGLDLYPADLYFNYLPSAAVLFLPWTWLPFEIGGALWRAINLLVFALGLARVCDVLETRHGNQVVYFPIATLFAITMAWSAARYGQMTLAMAGLMMLAVASLQRGDNWRAALFLAVAIGLKPPAIVLALVVIAVFPGVRVPALFFSLAIVTLPFLFQSADYVFEQYRAVPEMLLARATRIWPYPHVFGLLDSIGISTIAGQRTIVRVTTGLLVLGACWRVRRSNLPPGVSYYLYALPAAYILLLGEGTEHNTYAMMAPIMGLAMALALHERRKGTVITLAAMWLITVLSHTLMRSLPNVPLMAMLKPLVCVGLMAVLIAAGIRRLRQAQNFPQKVPRSRLGFQVKLRDVLTNNTDTQ